MRTTDEILAALQPFKGQFTKRPGGCIRHKEMLSFLTGFNCCPLNVILGGVSTNGGVAQWMAQIHGTPVSISEIVMYSADNKREDPRFYISVYEKLEELCGP